VIRLAFAGKEAVYQFAGQIEYGNRIVVIFRKLRDNLQGVSTSPTV
jgi:hypothetical protein